jgi:hypothetical protein
MYNYGIPKWDAASFSAKRDVYDRRLNSLMLATES